MGVCSEINYKKRNNGKINKNINITDNTSSSKEKILSNHSSINNNKNFKNTKKTVIPK